MTAEYPKEDQNPPTIPGSRPTDPQPEPRVRVPDPNEHDGGDHRPGNPKQTTQEEPGAGTPIQ